MKKKDKKGKIAAGIYEMRTRDTTGTVCVVNVGVISDAPQNSLGGESMTSHQVAVEKSPEEALWRAVLELAMRDLQLPGGLERHVSEALLCKKSKWLALLCDLADVSMDCIVREAQAIVGTRGVRKKSEKNKRKR